MDENPYKAPGALQNERGTWSAIDTAWTGFIVLGIAVLLTPMLFLPDDLKTPGQKVMLEFAETLSLRGLALEAVLFVPLAAWTWWRRRSA